MADGKKVDPYEVFYFVYLFAAVIGLAFCGYLKLNDLYFSFKNSLLSGYTVGFCGGALLMAARIVTKLNRSKWKFDLRLSLLTAAAVITLICGINSFAIDSKQSKVVDRLTLVEKTEDSSGLYVLLSEYSGKSSADPSPEPVTLDVYRTSGKIAKKLGTVDETYFSIRCVEAKAYDYTYGEDGILTLTCHYGYFGDGIVTLNPVYDTGDMTYTFKVK